MRRRYAAGILLTALLSAALLSSCSEASELPGGWQLPGELREAASAAETPQPSPEVSRPAEGISPEEQELNSGRSERSVKTADVPYIRGISSDPGSITLRLTDKDSGLLSPDSKGLWELFDLSDKGIVGIGLGSSSDDLTSHDIENTAYTEMYLGIRAEISAGRYLTLSPYDNISSGASVRLSVTDAFSGREMFSSESGELRADLWQREIVNGVYILSGEFNRDGETGRCCLYLLVNCESDFPEGQHFYICKGLSGRAEGNDTPSERAKKLNELISAAGITPEGSLSTAIEYPVEFDVSSYDTYYWQEKSRELIGKGSDYSDAFKVTLLHDWMTSHLIFDTYKSEVLKTSRYLNTKEPERWLVSASGVGVCRDFANIFAIMCRSQGIPCISLDSAALGHMWNAVYLDGEWRELDVTTDICRFAREEDISEVTGSRLYRYAGFMNSAKTEYPETVNRYLHIHE